MLRDVGRGERLGSDAEHRHEPAEQKQPTKLSVPEDLARAAQRVPHERRFARLPSFAWSASTSRITVAEKRNDDALTRSAPLGVSSSRRSAADGVPADLCELHRDANERPGGHVGVGRHARPHERRACTARERQERPDPEYEREQDGHRHPRHGHRGCKHCGGGVAADDEPPRTHAVDDAREEAAAEHEREEAEREAQRCEKRRAGAAVDEDRQCHCGDARPADRDELAHEERAELPRPERRPVADAHVVFAAHADRVGEAADGPQVIRVCAYLLRDDALRAAYAGRPALGAVRLLAALGDAGRGEDVRRRARALTARAVALRSFESVRPGSSSRRCSPSAAARLRAGLPDAAAADAAPASARAVGRGPRDAARAGRARARALPRLGDRRAIPRGDRRLSRGARAGPRSPRRPAAGGVDRARRALLGSYPCVARARRRAAVADACPSRLAARARRAPSADSLDEARALVRQTGAAGRWCSTSAASC